MQHQKKFCMDTIEGNKFAYLGDVNGLRDLILREGFNVNEKNMDSETVLLIAAKMNRTEVLEMLILEAKANVHDADNDNITALHYAACNGNLQALKLLVQANANIESKDISGWSPLMYAASKGELPCVQYLVEDCAVDIWEADTAGRTAHAIAVRRRQDVLVADYLKKLMDSDKEGGRMMTKCAAFIPTCKTTLF